MVVKSYAASVFIDGRKISDPNVAGKFCSSLSWARRELRRYWLQAESIYRNEVAYRHRGLVGIAPTLKFGILTETKDTKTGSAETDFSVTYTYTAEDFVSETRGTFIAFAAEDFGYKVAAAAARVVDEQLAGMSWYSRYEIWDCLASYDIYNVSTADHLIDGAKELAVALADGHTADVDGKIPVAAAFHRAVRKDSDQS